MKTTEEGGGTKLPLFVDRGIGWRRGGVMVSLSLLGHASVVWLAGFVPLAPLNTETDAAATAGDPTEVEIVQIDPEPAVEPPIEVVEIDPIPKTDFSDITSDPTPIPVEKSRPIVVQRPATATKPRLRGVEGGTRGPALAAGGNLPTGWSTPRPVYPFQARRLRLQGSGGVCVTTNGMGRVIMAEMLPGIDPTLDAAATSYARQAWTGPPNRTRVVAITFVLE